MHDSPRLKEQRERRSESLSRKGPRHPYAETASALILNKGVAGQQLHPENHGVILKLPYLIGIGHIRHLLS